MIRNYYLAADSQQYAAWNRTRRLRATPYLARTETNTSRRATAISTGLENPPSTTTGVEAVSTEPQTEKRQETLFGPNIGIVSDGPTWAQSEDAKKGTPSDYLTPEIVRRWVETSKEGHTSFSPLITYADIFPDNSTYDYVASLSQSKTTHTQTLPSYTPAV